MIAALKKAVRGALSPLGTMAQIIPADAGFYSVATGHVFGGYYDVSPFSPDGALLLGQCYKGANVSPHRDHPPLELGFFNIDDPGRRFEPFAQSLTWNWQQGCRLQWVPSAGPRAIFFNTLLDGRYKGILYDIAQKKTLSALCSPLYALSTDGRYGLSLNFSALHAARRGYGYSNLPDDGDRNLYLIDIEANRKQAIFSLAAAEEFEPQADMGGAAHYFNHLSFNPAATLYMVKHLWMTPEGRRRSRTLILDKSGHIVTCLNSTGLSSHYAWRSDQEITVFDWDEEDVARYRSYDLEAKEIKIIGDPYLRQDGHPTWINENTLVTDTYRDMLSRQSVLFYDAGCNIFLKYATLSVPPSFTGEVRCDLHPRIDIARRRICVDTVRKNRRGLLVFQLPEV
ncbi:MAG: hypothetical protein ACT4OY_08920 [Alphaproteobacteria bacterium]